jgi:NAD(P)-dependent dehydrogenase (short-subunit alcohol dehydrogenase family)
MVCCSLSWERLWILLTIYISTVSDAEQVKQTIGNVLKDFGRMDILVANAGEQFITLYHFVRFQLCLMTFFFATTFRYGNIETDFGTNTWRIQKANVGQR